MLFRSGFAGRYVAGNRGELSAIMDRTGEKIRRIRGKLPPLSPSWQLPPETAPVYKDAWVKRLAVAAVACLALTLLLFFTYKIVLGSGASDIRTAAAQGGIR